MYHMPPSYCVIAAAKFNEDMCGFGGLFLRCGFKNAESTFKEIHTR
jgi:hypothetical protein